jgi:7,8-dihydropterin-6-yl-methyl-4-(beta-D-ribofuranosyl)aminobenzene 5'-phosphate synthase
MKHLLLGFILFFTFVYSVFSQDKNQLYQIPEKIGPGLDTPVTITVIYDNYLYMEGLENDWGFACLIEGAEKTILFDTGRLGDLFLRNFDALGLDADMIDVIVVSHEHGDHTGGLIDFLKRKSGIPVLVTESFSDEFIQNVEKAGAEPVLLKEPIQICKDVYLSGEMGGRIKEHSLAINTKNGLVVITGCSHPGIVEIMKQFQTILKKDIHVAMGGFHLLQKSETQMNGIIQQMKDLGLKKCGATHCTGDKQIQMFKDAFGNDYIDLGVGNRIIF